MFLNTMFQTPMGRFQLESKWKLPLFHASPSPYSIGYVGPCEPFGNLLSSSAVLFGCFDVPFVAQPGC